MITIQRIEQLLKAQDDLNKVYAGEDWATKGYDFLGYAAVETAELLNHHGGMFHYRKQEPDWPQIEMELVDILHFLLSAAIQTDLTAEEVREWAVAGGSETLPIAVALHGKTLMGLCSVPDLIVGVEDRHGKAIAQEPVSLAWRAFAMLVRSCDFTLDHIFNKYQLKYTLNRFRIANGSVTGEYKKVWADGREDNEHLQELAARAFNQITGEYNLDMLTELLQQRYSTKDSDPLSRLKSEGFTKQDDGTWQKLCKTADERGDAISKIVCLEYAGASSMFVAGKGWIITAKLKERRPI